MAALCLFYFAYSNFCFASIWSLVYTLFHIHSIPKHSSSFPWKRSPAKICLRNSQNIQQIVFIYFLALHFYFETHNFHRSQSSV